MGKKKVNKKSDVTHWFDVIRTDIKCTLRRGSSGPRLELSTENDLEAIALEDLLGGKGKVSSGKTKTMLEVDYLSCTRDFPGIRGICFKVVDKVKAQKELAEKGLLRKPGRHNG